MSNNLIISILAAGKGTRMNSKLPKVLHKLNGISLIESVIKTSAKLNPCKIIAIVGYKKDLVINELKKYKIEFAIQNTQKGTGHAVKQCKKIINNIEGNLLILSGDVPLITSTTLNALISAHQNNNSIASFVTSNIQDPFGYGRIIRDNKNNFIKIVEHKDANEAELKINEINAGIYIFDIKTLFEKISLINNNNEQDEYFIGDVLEHINPAEITVFKTNNSHEILGVNNIEQLNEVNKKNII